MSSDGLDTLNPILIIGDNLKLIGEYEETIGTCYVFTESGQIPSQLPQYLLVEKLKYMVSRCPMELLVNKTLSYRLDSTMRILPGAPI
ncbi:hypothetical protein IFM89_017199 [Coptis chinensis]|uniref:Transcription factor TFIIIC triple barrel domain-containing protein n=1 Tax=Coptis chinensis TaxID=261450 RepID=A0A835IVV1_9MAGN|nr:hypothetical protein IFM89_017199 [Coptis chinensis]